MEAALACLGESNDIATSALKNSLLRSLSDLVHSTPATRESREMHEPWASLSCSMNGTQVRPFNQPVDTTVKSVMDSKSACTPALSQESGERTRIISMS